MKRSEFIACLINSFGGRQAFADAFRERLTGDSFSDNDTSAHLWHCALGMLEQDNDPRAKLAASLVDAMIVPMGNDKPAEKKDEGAK